QGVLGPAETALRQLTEQPVPAPTPSMDKSHIRWPKQRGGPRSVVGKWSRVPQVSASGAPRPPGSCFPAHVRAISCPSSPLERRSERPAAGFSSSSPPDGSRFCRCSPSPRERAGAASCRVAAQRLREVFSGADRAHGHLDGTEVIAGTGTRPRQGVEKGPPIDAGKARLLTDRHAHSDPAVALAASPVIRDESDVIDAGVAASAPLSPNPRNAASKA